MRRRAGGDGSVERMYYPGMAPAIQLMDTLETFLQV